MGSSLIFYFGKTFFFVLFGFMTDKIQNINLLLSTFEHVFEAVSKRNQYVLIN
jgi:hypothetical protein